MTAFFAASFSFFWHRARRACISFNPDIDVWSRLAVAGEEEPVAASYLYIQRRFSAKDLWPLLSALIGSRLQDIEDGQMLDARAYMDLRLNERTHRVAVRDIEALMTNAHPD